MDALTLSACIATIISGLAVLFPLKQWLYKFIYTINLKRQIKNNELAIIQLDSKFNVIDEALFKKEVLMLLYSANENKTVQVQFNTPELEKVKVRKSKLERINTPSEDEIKDLFILQSIIKNNQKNVEYLSVVIEKTFSGKIFSVLKTFITPDEWVIVIRRYVESIAEGGVVSGTKFDIWIDKPKQISFGIWVNHEDGERICTKLKIPSFQHMFGHDLMELPRDILISKAIPNLIMRLLEFLDKYPDTDINEYLIFFAWNIGEG
jgi:hypothetical protein